MRELVSDADLIDPVDELWLTVLRKGFPDVRLADLDITRLPIFRDDDPGACRGYYLAVLAPETGELVQCEFSIHSLAHVAERGSQRLIDAGRLRQGQQYFYRIHAEPAEGTWTWRPRSAETGSHEFSVKVKTVPLTYAKLALEPLLSQARAVDLRAGDRFAVFFTEEVLAKAERASRLGEKRTPPVETGALLVGTLAACPVTGEFFCVVCDVLALAGAKQETYSLEASSTTWAQLQPILAAMQRQPASRTFRMLGSAHGHPWPPVGAEDPQHQPPNRPLLNSLSSAFLSPADRMWTNCMFAGQPFKLALVFGQTCGGARTHKLFGLEDGRLHERGYYVIPDLQLKPTTN